MKKRMILKSSILASLILAIVICISCTQNNSKDIKPIDKSEEIENLLHLYEEYDLFEGSALIAHQGKVILNNGYGISNNKVNTESTKFHLASISKQFTAMLTMQLVAEGKLKLDSPVAAYLPEFPKEKADLITIHHLLSHSDGIPDIADIREHEPVFEGEINPENIITHISELPLLYTPGKRFEYGNSGYILLGNIIENVTKQSFGDVLQEKILDPLKMTNSGLLSSENQLDTDKNEEWYKKFNLNYFNISSIYSAGGMYCSPKDLLIWDQALYTDVLLSEKYRKMLFEKHFIAGGRHYGYGWFINQFHRVAQQKSIETQSHGGYSDSFKADVTRIPSSKSLVVVLNNLENIKNREISNAILCILYDQPYDLPKKPIIKTTLEIIQKDGIKAGISYFDGVIAKSGICSTERETLTLGYTLLKNGKTQNAAEIFKICMREFKNSYLGYDSYAETQVLLGNIEEAKTYYLKSLELNPKNKNAKEILKKLN